MYRNGGYEVESDEKGQVVFTDENRALILSMIKFNEEYRLFYEKDLFLEECGIEKDKGIESLTESEWRFVIRLLDRINSTHLSVSGKNKGDNAGIKIFCEKFCKNKEVFLSKISTGDGAVVNELARLVDGRNNFSFSTKFCEFVNRVFYGGDEYVVFDAILEKALPYFEGKYCGKIDLCKNARRYADNNNYDGYRKAVDAVLEKIRVVVGDFSRFDFDQMVWFYYKNQPSRLKKQKF